MQVSQRVGKRVVLAGALALVLTSCQTTEEKVGTGVGAVAGMAVGSLFGDGSGRIVAMALGAAAGAWIGNQIGRQLAEADQQKLAEATQGAAVQGKSQSWSNPDTGVSGTARVVNTEVQERPQKVAYKKDRVDEMPPFEYVGETYKARSAVNVRGGPSTDYKVVSGLQGGQEIDVIGKVQNRDWYVIGNDGVADGFVSAKYLGPTGQPAALSPKGATSADIETAQVAVGQRCRDVEQVVVLKSGKEIKETVRACQGPDGWEVQAA